MDHKGFLEGDLVGFATDAPTIKSKFPFRHIILQIR